MSQVVVDVGLSLDGYMAPDGMTIGDPPARSTTWCVTPWHAPARMFDQGEVVWPETAPFHAPVYVLSQEQREPWVRPGEIALAPRRPRWHAARAGCRAGP